LKEDYNVDLDDDHHQNIFPAIIAEAAEGRQGWGGNDSLGILYGLRDWIKSL
jgi:hypothetical protein